MKTIKIAYKATYILLLICVLGSLYFESSYVLYGNIRFITLTVLYSLGLLFGILSPVLFLIRCIAEKSANRIWVSVFTLVPILLLAYHSAAYYKDLFNGKAEFQSDIFYIENFEMSSTEKYVTLEYEDKWYNLRLSDEIYDLLETIPPDKSRTEYFEYLLLDIYPHKCPVKIVFYQNTGIICDVQILNC